MAKQKSKKGGKKTVKSSNSIAKGLRVYFMWGMMVLAFLLYGNTLGHQYAFDDSIVITGNQFTKNGISGIKDLLTRDFFEGIYGKKTELTGGRYRPLSLVMFAVEYHFFGDNPFIGHLLNVLMYGFVGILLFLFLERLFAERSSPIPYLTSFLFMLHPIHTEVVANIKSRDEILCLIFLLIALIASLKAVDTKKLGKWMSIAVVTYFLSLMAKETAITYLPLFPLFMYVFRKEQLKLHWPTFGALAVTAVAYMALRISLVGMIGGEDSSDIMENPFVNAPFLDKYATIFLILLKYFWLLVLPHPLTADYSFNQIPIVGWSNIWAILGLLFYLAIGIYAALKIWKKDWVALGIFCYLAPLSITSNIVFNIGAPMAERFLFIPSIGFCLIVAMFLGKIFEVKKVGGKLKINYLFLVLLGGIILLSTIKVLTRNVDWYDNKTLFSKDVKTAPNSAKMLYYHGNVLLKEYMATPKPENLPLLDEAEKSFLRGLEINPEFIHLTYNLGNVYDQKKEPQKALKYLNRSLELKPTHINTHTLLGKIYGQYLNNPERAIHYLERSVYEFEVDNPSVLQNLGNAYAIGGQFDKAIKVFGELLEKDNSNAKYHLNLAITYQKMGQNVLAEPYFYKAFSLDPSLKR